VPREFAGTFAGRLEVGGLDVARSARGDVAARVGLVFQDPESQLVMDRVDDDVAFGLENRGWPVASMVPAVSTALTEVRLAGLEQRRPNTLSGGEQQRLALAGVLTADPGLLVLDEPTANLDPAGAAALFARLSAIRGARAATMVIVEHRVDLAWPLADRLLVLGRDGRPIDEGPRDEVVARSGPRLIEAGVWLPAEVEAGIRAANGLAGPHVPAPRRGVAAAARDLSCAAAVSFEWERGRRAVDGVDLAVGAGERVALLGRNGSGKSTLGRLLVGLLRPTAGSVTLAGHDPSRVPPADLARLAGYAFQDPEHQFLRARVRDEVELGLRPDERARVPELMDRLGLPLEGFAARSPYTLSGGEQRRLSLATILVRAPRLLVLDEPTFGQDRANHEALVAILRDRVDAGAALVAATHDLGFAAALLDRSVVLSDGCVVADEPTEGLVRVPERLAAYGLGPLS